MAEELLVPHVAPRDRVPLATSVRGMVILTSLRALRARGHEDAYRAKLSARWLREIDTLTAATWFPIEFAFAHYTACEALELPIDVIDDIGAESGRFINHTVLSVVARLSRESGITPWTALINVNKLGSRNWIGSSYCVWKTGPKEARLEWVQQPLSRIPYFRKGFGAFTRGICGMFAQKLYVRDVPNPRPAELTYRVSWV